MSTASISGLSSGIDWQSMIDQLRNIEYNRITLLTQEKATYQSKLTAWQGINTKLLSLKTATDALNRSSDFNVFTTSLTSNSDTEATNLLSASAGEDAAPGSYNIVVNSVATAQKLSSESYANATTELGLSGDILVGGRSVSVSATDTLRGLRDKINAVNTGTNASGVTASIVDYGTEGTRLILTSDDAGATGIQILNGGSADILGSLGLVDASAKTAKNAVTGGNQSDALAYADRAVGGSDVLNLSSAQSGTVDITINGNTQSVAMDLATDSLNEIRDAINTAFSGTFTSDPASVVSETEDGTTTYRLLIEGSTITYTDANNMLETLGVLERAGASDVRGVTGDVANTASGTAITAATSFDTVDGYIDITTSDTITLSGTDTSGAAVNTVFSLYDGGAYKTVGDLLTEIESAFGDVTASITADGKLRVVDNEINDTDLSVVLTPSGSSLSFDQDTNLGAVATIRKRELQAGENAEITVDGVTVTPSSNTVEDVIEGVTLNLKAADAGTTVTLNVGRDDAAIIEKVQGFVSAYNDVLTAIQAQTSYNEETGKTGGPLFGDSSLRTLRSTLSSIVLNKVAGVSDDFSTLGLVGISIGSDSKLTMDEAVFGDYLETNFEDVRRLFATDWSSTNSHISYTYHTTKTQAGTYDVNISGVDPVDGYFVTPGDAEGSTTYLKGLSGDVEGLRISYAGTATGNVGTFTLTYGIAELFDRALQGLTDSTNGFVATKEESIQGTMDRMDDRIADMEDRVERKMQTMTNQFIAMENAMRTLQSQSAWLSSQIGTLSSGWA